MFSTKSLLKKFVQVIAIRDNFQYVTVKSNKKVLNLQCVLKIANGHCMVLVVFMVIGPYGFLLDSILNTHVFYLQIINRLLLLLLRT